jgi:nucleotide-binding universal stress UspA family protein
MNNAPMVRIASEAVAVGPEVAESVRACAMTEGGATNAILAAVRPTDADGAVLWMAQWLADRENRELHILSVIENGPPISPFAAGVPVIPPFHDEEERQVVKRDLMAAYERSGRAIGRVRVDVVEGSATTTIADIAREHNVHLVVVGRGTHGFLSHLVYGEQVRDIIRSGQRPVLVVPPAPPAPIDRAMVAFDFSLASIRAAVTAHEMLEPGGRLTLVHVATPRNVTGDRSQWWLRSSERRTRKTLGEVVRALPARAGVTVEMEKLHGDPIDVLIQYAHAHEMQLLACGWHEHALLERIVGGSNTVELLHRAECAVLVAPGPGAGGKGDVAA